MNGHSRSTLFLMEQLVVILVFAICSAVCVTIFVESYQMERHSLDMNYALLAAGSGAECYKASGGDTRKAAERLSDFSVFSGGAAAVYYDEDWNPCGEAGAFYVLRITPESSLRAEITVGKADGEEFVTLTVAARGDGG